MTIFTTRAGLRNVFAPTIRPSRTLLGALGPAGERHVPLEHRPGRVADDRVEVVPRPQRVVAEPVDERAGLAAATASRCTAARRGLRASPPRTLHSRPPGRSPRSYLISVSSLNIGRYIERMIVPTMAPTMMIMIGSMIEVSDAIDASTSSS